MLSRLALGRPILTMQNVSMLKSVVQKHAPNGRINIFREFTKDSKQGVTRGGTRNQPTLKERIMAPPGENAYSLGKGALAGASAVGLGALCFYGIGLGKPGSIYTESMIWPEYVKQRVQATYAYFAGSILITAASSFAVFNSPRLLHMVTRSGWMSMIGTFAVMIGSGVLTQSIPYSSGIGPKQLAWAAHCAIMGAIVAPICFLGGPIIARAAWYTAGVVGGLSTVAACAPSDKFLYMGGPLAIGLGVVFASSLANMWFPTSTALGAGLYSVSLYGGLILFSGFLLYDTQRIVKYAQGYPAYAARPYDPVNACLSIYMDALNIFIRIASILAGGGGNRRK